VSASVKPLYAGVSDGSAPMPIIAECDQTKHGGTRRLAHIAVGLPLVIVQPNLVANFGAKVIGRPLVDRDLVAASGFPSISLMPTVIA